MKFNIVSTIYCGLSVQNCLDLFIFDISIVQCLGVYFFYRKECSLLFVEHFALTIFNCKHRSNFSDNASAL